MAEAWHDQHTKQAGKGQHNPWYDAELPKILVIEIQASTLPAPLVVASLIIVGSEKI